MKALILTLIMMNSFIIFDFSSSSDWSGWSIVNDVVMGGKSNSKISRSKAGNAIFTGEVSLESNGGFASIQYNFKPIDITGYTKAIIHLRGDGKQYQFRIKANMYERASYIHSFNTSGDWQTIEIALGTMVPTWRGNKLNQPNFASSQIQQVQFMISNGKAESFNLEIEKIELM